MNESIPIALDTEIFLALIKWHERDFDKDGIIHTLANLYGKPHPSRVKANMVNRDKPEILNDEWLSKILRTNKGDRIYTNLDNIIRLYHYIETGRVKIYVLPTVYKELCKIDISKDFLKQYSNRIFVKDNDWDKFSNETNKIAQKYIDNGAIESQDCDDVNADLLRARKMAEASRIGFYFVVKRGDKYLHKYEYRDFARVGLIRRSNKENNLLFKSNNGIMRSASPMTLASFIQCVVRDKYAIEDKRSFYIPYPSIDENNNYLPDGKMDEKDIVKNTFESVYTIKIN